MQVISLKVPVLEKLLIALRTFWSHTTFLGTLIAMARDVGTAPQSAFLLFPSPLPSSTYSDLPDLHTTETNSVSIVRAWEHFIRLSNSFSFLDLLELEFAERSWTQNPTGLLSPNPDPIYIFYSLKSFNMSQLGGPR